jgi:hypothetical protein
MTDDFLCLLSRQQMMLQMTDDCVTIFADDFYVAILQMTYVIIIDSLHDDMT